MVLDSGCSTVMLTWAVASQLGMHPSDATQSMRCTLADGRTIEAKRMVLKSVQVGPFAVQDVECAVLPESATATDLLLGGSFLREFKVELDREAGLVHLTRYGAPPSVASALPPASSGTSTGPIDRPTTGQAPFYSLPEPRPIPPDPKVLTDDKVGGG